MYTTLRGYAAPVQYSNGPRVYPLVSGCVCRTMPSHGILILTWPSRVYRCWRGMLHMYDAPSHMYDAPSGRIYPHTILPRSGGTWVYLPLWGRVTLVPYPHTASLSPHNYSSIEGIQVYPPLWCRVVCLPYHTLWWRPYPHTAIQGVSVFGGGVLHMYKGSSGRLCPNTILPRSGKLGCIHCCGPFLHNPS